MFAYCLSLCLTLSGIAGQQPPNVAAQKEAMKKLEFLVGRWTGKAKISRGPGPAMQITQHENVQFKLDGLVMLIEGTGRKADGSIAFQALATVAYDEAAKVYRFRAYNDGRYLDTDLKVNGKGFVWGFESGPVKVTNIMALNEKGEWSETTSYVFAESAPKNAVEMLLQKDPADK